MQDYCQECVQYRQPPAAATQSPTLAWGLGLDHIRTGSDRSSVTSTAAIADSVHPPSRMVGAPLTVEGLTWLLLPRPTPPVGFGGWRRPGATDSGVGGVFVDVPRLG